MSVEARNALWIVVAAALIDAIGFGIVLPVVPGLIVDLAAVPMSEASGLAGWLMVAFAGAQFLFGPVMGNLSDRFGRRPVIMFSMLAFGLDYLLMAFAPSFIWLFLGRLVAGISGAVYGAANAVIADITPPERRAQSFGYLGAAFGIGFIIGPALGGLLGALGPRAPFVAAGLLALINAAAAYVLLPESLASHLRRPFDPARANPFGAFASLRRHAGLSVLLTAFFLHMLAHQVYPATWSFYAVLKFDWSPAEIGFSLAYTGVMMTLVQVFLTGRLVDGLGPRRAIGLGLVIETVGFLGYALAPAGWVVYPLMTLAALQAIVYPAISAILSQAVGADEQGELQGGIASLQSVSSILGPAAFSQSLAYFTGPSAPVVFPGAAFLIAAALSGLAFILALAPVAAKKEASR